MNKIKINIDSLKRRAKNIRKHIVVMSGRINASHSGSALSPVEIVTALYFSIMKINSKKPNWLERDRFILSKGHGGAVLYSALAEAKFISGDLLKKFCADGSPLVTHPVVASISGVSGVEATAGSLGHGLSIGIGMALAGRYDKKSYNVFVLVSDGECDEGSLWEGVLYAGAKKIDNLIMFVDYNKIQSFGRTAEVLDLEPFADKFKSFNWHVQEIDGHNFKEIIESVKIAKEKKGKPHCIIAHTIKGKGVSYMENKLEWHYHSPTGELMNQAIKDIESGYEAKKI